MYKLGRQNLTLRLWYIRLWYCVSCTLSCTWQKEKKWVFVPIISEHACTVMCVVVSFSVSFSLCVCACVRPCIATCVLASPFSFTESNTHIISCLLSPRRLWREQLSGTKRCCNVRSPPDQATQRASQQHNTHNTTQDLPLNQAKQMHVSLQCSRMQWSECVSSGLHWRFLLWFELNHFYEGNLSLTAAHSARGCYTESTVWARLNLQTTAVAQWIKGQSEVMSSFDHNEFIIFISYWYLFRSLKGRAAVCPHVSSLMSWSSASCSGLDGGTENLYRICTDGHKSSS